MKSGDVITASVPFVSKTVVNLDATDVSELYDNAVDKIQESMARFQMKGSNWRFKTVEKVHINTVVYRPLKGNSYIPLLAAKKAIINMKNKDNECFKWCITRALNPVGANDHSTRITKELKKQAESLNWNGIMFPTTLREIDKFESNNNDISVNVFGYEIWDLFIFYEFRRTSEKKHRLSVADFRRYNQPLLFDKKKSKSSKWQ